MSARIAQAPCPTLVAKRRAAARQRALQRRHPRLSRLLAWLLSAVLGSAGLAYAQVAPGTLPSGGQVVVGSAQLQHSANLLVVQQNTPRLGLDWQSFNIGSGATVEFKQPNASSVALNRVLGNSGTEIYGQLKANGQVFLTNPNGVLFAPGAKVDVGGLVASTLDLSQQDFAAGRYVFNAVEKTGSVVNQGTIKASAGGYLALFGQQVDNQGAISVDAGSVLLASGRAATVSISGSGLISAVVTPGAQGRISNSGSLSADGGTVTLTAQSAQDIATSLVNNSGLIRANTLVERSGEIWITGDQVASSGKITADAVGSGKAGRVSLLGDMAHGSVAVGGEISARSDSGAGGQVETSAALVSVARSTRVDTRGGEGAGGSHGTWTIDPTDFTVSSGGAAQTASGIGADTLSANLATGNITLATVNNSGTDAGDLSVNAAVSWSANTRLTLQAWHDVNINADISASGNTAGLTLTPNLGQGSGAYRINNTASVRPKITLSGSTPTLQIAGNSYTVVKDLAALQAIDGNATVLGGNYALGVDIDASATASANSGAGFNPIGDETNGSTKFSGRFDGLGHTVSALTINRPTSNYTGLFAVTSNATVQNFTLSSASIAGSQYVGGAVGYAQGSTKIANVVAGGTFSSNDNSNSGVTVGGVAGRFDGSSGATISGSSSSGTVYGESNTTMNVGGVVGYSGGSLADVGSSAVVTANDRNSKRGDVIAGGVVGSFSAPRIDRATASGAVSGAYYAGGVAGYADITGGIADASASGNVGGTQYAGGLAGATAGAGGITRGSATGRVTATNANSYAGGLVGDHGASGGISNAQASGDVAGGYYVGGLAGDSSSAISGSSASGKVTGTSGYAGGLVGRTSGGGVSNSQATGAVSGPSYVGGLAGDVYGGSVVGSSASGSVTAIGSSTQAGGLVGQFNGYVNSSVYGISNSSASGTVFADVGNGYVGGLVGYFYYGTGISGSSATNAVTLIDSSRPTTGVGFVGGLVGYFVGYTPSDITNSHTTFAANSSSRSQVTGGSYSGGLVGYFNAGSITGSSSSAPVASLGYAGGLVGQFVGVAITDSSASGSTSSSSSSGYYVGGLVGWASNTSALNNVSASGNVTGVDGGSVGGLVGYETGGITNGFASGNVTIATNSGYVGGLVGQANSANTAGTSINDSAATGNVSGGSYSGGLIGYYYNANGYGGIINSHASGNVTGSPVGGGGLVGYYTGYSASTTSDIRNSYATGNVQARNYGGGLVGYYGNQNGISGSYATGNVTGAVANTDKYLGGLVGYYSNTAATALGGVRGSFATGKVAASNSGTGYTTVFAGGLIGYLTGTAANLSVTDDYASGAVSISSTSNSGNYVGAGLVAYAGSSLARTYASGGVVVTGGSTRLAAGLVAQRGGTTVTAASSYWDTTSSGVATSVLGSGLTSVQMKQASNFGGFDIANSAGANTIWRIYDGYTRPLLSKDFLTPLSLTLADAGKTYDGSTSFGDAPLNDSSGRPIGHPERIFVNTASANVGSYSVAAAGVYSSQLGYDISVTGSATLTVNARPVTLVGVIADKTYDSTRSALLASNAQPTGLVLGEDLTFNTSAFSAVFADKNAGSNKAVTITGLALADGTTGRASNYALTNASSSTASIAKAALAAGGFSATNRTYDGSTTVAVTATPASSVTGIFGSDSVAVDLTSVSSGTMADKNAGSAKGVNVSGATLTGTDAGNYRIAGIDGVSVNIAQRGLVANNLNATDRQYNATTNVTVSTTSGVLNGAISGDNVSLANQSLSGTMADKNVGTGKAVTVTGIALRGPDAANYSVTAGATSVDIAPYQTLLYFTNTSSANRIYNGTNVANVAVAFSQWGNDNATLTTNTPTYADKNVSVDANGNPTSKTITVGGATLSGTDAANYSFTTYGNSITTSGIISPKSLGVTGVNAVNRVYDATRNVNVNIAAAAVDTTTVIAGDDVGVAVPSTGTVVGTVANKNVGTGKAVTVPGLTLTGLDKGNYTVSGNNGVTVSITKKDLTAVYTGLDKVYNGNALAALSVGSADIVSGDVVSFYADQSYCGACYAYFATANSTPTQFTQSKNAGTGKTIVVTFNGLYNTDAANYSLLNPTGTTSASITPKGITPVFTGNASVYDGSVNASVALNKNSSGVYGGDLLVSTQAAIFTGSGAKNVGTGKAVSISNVALTGADAGNYTLNATTASTTASVTPKPVTLTGVTATDRAYDGTLSVAVSGNNVSSNSFVANDVVSIALPPNGLSSGTIASKNVGANKPVTVTGLSLAGSDAGNYLIDLAGSGITVNITQKGLTASFVGGTRAYNGGVTAPVVASSADIVGGDTVTFGQNALFTGIDARNAGTNKPVSVTNIVINGADAANYSLLSTTASTTGTVTAKALTVSFAGVGRVYNGVNDTSASVVGSSTDVVAGDQVIFSDTARFHTDGAAGTNKVIDISGITLAGAQAINYALTASTATTTATISKKPIGVTGIVATNRGYDGTKVVSINVAAAAIDISGVVSGDTLVATIPPNGISTGTMETKDAGTAKEVLVTGLGLAGNSAANYTLTGATGLTVNITPKAVSAAYLGIGKVYDGTNSAQVTASSSGFLAGDVGAVGVKATGVFSAGKNAGTAKTVAVSGGFLDGVERNNYTLTTATVPPS